MKRSNISEFAAKQKIRQEMLRAKSVADSDLLNQSIVSVKKTNDLLLKIHERMRQEKHSQMLTYKKLDDSRSHTELGTKAPRMTRNFGFSNKRLDFNATPRENFSIKDQFRSPQKNLKNNKSVLNPIIKG
jgi:hypothetical protein